MVKSVEEEEEEEEENFGGDDGLSWSRVLRFRRRNVLVMMMVFQCALYNAVNLPWSNFTFGHICLNPPGAFYMVSPCYNAERSIIIDFLSFWPTL